MRKEKNQETRATGVGGVRESGPPKLMKTSVTYFTNAKPAPAARCHQINTTSLSRGEVHPSRSGKETHRHTGTQRQTEPPLFLRAYTWLAL